MLTSVREVVVMVAGGSTGSRSPTVLASSPAAGLFSADPAVIELSEKGDVQKWRRSGVLFSAVLLSLSTSFLFRVVTSSRIHQAAIYFFSPSTFESEPQTSFGDWLASIWVQTPVFL